MKTHAELPEWAIHKAAQLWCLPEHSHKEMDAAMAMSIARELDAAHRRGAEEMRERASNVIADHMQGVMELVNSGDMTLSEIRPKMRELGAIQRDIRALPLEEK